MTVVEQLGIGARAEMQMAATRDLGFWLAAILWRRRVLKLPATWGAATRSQNDQRPRWSRRCSGRAAAASPAGTPA